MMSIRSLAESMEVPLGGRRWQVGTDHPRHPGPELPSDTTSEGWGLLTGHQRGPHLATSGYFFMATDTGTDAANAGTTLAAYSYGRDNAGQVNSQAGDRRLHPDVHLQSAGATHSWGDRVHHHRYAYDPANHPPPSPSTGVRSNTIC